jgi:2-C-methyl-D-erythritol 4-phosphate cytidylyltransferase
MHLLIPAAGSGRRMGAGHNKLFLPLRDRPVLAWTLEAVAATTTIEWIGILSQPEDRSIMQEIIDQVAIALPIEFIDGGSTRQASVYNGIQYLLQKGSVSHVLIHDGARCLASPALFDRCSTLLSDVDALIAAIPVKDTIKIAQPQTNGIQWIQSTPDRSTLWAAQTPQGFALPLLAQVHQQAVVEGWQVTDDAALFEKVGWGVALVEGEETNLKLTTPLDMIMAERILEERSHARLPLLGGR